MSPTSINYDNLKPFFSEHINPITSNYYGVNLSVGPVKGNSGLKEKSIKVMI